ncbi:MAG: hypothetical protein WDZ45_12245 [Flavobacteriaceae bacterium]
MSQLQHSIKTLFHLHGQIGLIVETLNEVGNNYKKLKKIELKNYFDPSIDLETSTHTLLSTYAIILFNSFMDEYEKYFIPSIEDFKYKDKILKVKNKNKPGIARIKKWKDLKKFRNYFAAHNYRINNDSFFSNKFKSFDLLIPNTISEKNLFYGIVHLICISIKNEFQDIVNEFDKNEIMLNKINFIGNPIDNEKELCELYYKML